MSCDSDLSQAGTRLPTMADKMDVSSPESSGESVATPKEQLIASSGALSPPDSQQRTMPTSASGSSLANSNGKRPIQTISNGNDEVEGEIAIRISCLYALHMLTPAAHRNRLNGQRNGQRRRSRHTHQ